jgi:hypothetical protein
MGGRQKMKAHTKKDEESCPDPRGKNILWGGGYPRMALGNVTTVTVWEGRIEIVAPRMAVT